MKETKDKLKDIKITDTVESGIRKEQFSREKQWTEAGRNQKKANMNVNVTETVESG